MTKILHISNTDIDIDSRIRKELVAVGRLPAAEVAVIGVPDANVRGESSIDGARYIKLHMIARLMRPLPRAIRYTVELIEFTLKVVRVGRGVKPDIVHCHDTFALPAGWMLKKIYGSRLVYDAHELESNKNGQNAILSYATLLIEKVCWHRIDLLVSVSDSILDWYRDHLGPKKNILVLNSPEIDSRGCLSPHAQDGKYFHRLYSIPEGQLVFVYLGILGVGRGIEIALEAFASSSLDAHLVLVGYGDLTPLIESYCAKHQNIHLHAPVPHDQVVALVSDADVGLCLVENVSLSDYYCLPNKLFEYGFAGLHVLASDFPEIRKVVEQYSIGTCCALEPAKVREAIRSLIDHQPARKQVDLWGLSWEVQAERLVDAYRYLRQAGGTFKKADQVRLRS